MTNKEWALACAARGWLVFPSEGKKPLIRWSVGASTNPSVIALWWSNWPDADVCIKTGAESGIVVVDWDAYKEDNPKDEPIPELSGLVTYTCLTNKGGYHYYFAHPGYPVANSAGSVADYVDVRGDGGMVVAYQQVLLDVPLANLPERLAIRRTSPLVDPTVSLDPPNPFTLNKQDAWARNIYAAAKADIRFAPEGKRNFVLYAQASDVYRLVWAGKLDKDTVTQELGDLAQSIGLEPAEIAATLTSAMRNAASRYAKENS